MKRGLGDKIESFTKATGIKKVVDAGIPLITLNSGSDLFKGLGAITHVGQDETIAGRGAGERLKAAGGTVMLCAKQEQSNVALETRCNAAAETFGGKVIQITTSGDADRVAQQAEIKAAMDGGQHSQCQAVHLQQTQCFQVVLVPLDDRAV